MHTKPPGGLQLSCESVGHLQLFPALVAAALPLRRPAAARQEFNCEAASAGSQGLKSKFTQTPPAPICLTQSQGVKSKFAQTPWHPFAHNGASRMLGMLDIHCSCGLQIAKEDASQGSFKSPKRCFNLVPSRRHFHLAPSYWSRSPLAIILRGHGIKQSNLE